MKVLNTVYRFVVGDPILLVGGLSVMLVSWLLHTILGGWDGALIFLGITAVLVASLRFRPQ